MLGDKSLSAISPCFHPHETTEDKDKDDESDILDDTDQPQPKEEGGDTTVRKRQKQGDKSAVSEGETSTSSW